MSSNKPQSLEDKLRGILAVDKTQTAEVVHHGEKIIIPESITTSAAIDILTRQRDMDEQTIAFQTTINVFPWEGAVALEKAMKEVMGYTEMVTVRSFWGDNPPATIEVPISPTESVKAPWGRIQIDEDKSWIACDVGDDKGMMVFRITGQFRRKWQRKVDQIVAATRRIIETQPVYKGRALTIEFNDGNGEQLSIPRLSFYHVSSGEVSALTFSRSIEQTIAASILAPIQYRDACRTAGIPFKRGVLLAGPYGTGKTLLAHKVAEVSVQNAVTFIYIKNVAELPEAIMFARQYQPAVIFGEDLDRAVAGQERTEDIDEILNTLDGIDSKGTDVMVVLTTNHLEDINKAMLRPGRIDVLVHVAPPDAEAAMRLVRVYGKHLVTEAELPEIGKLLNGRIPAVIREVVERAKLVTISRTGKAPALGSITDSDLCSAAISMEAQLEVLNENVPKIKAVQVEAAEIMAKGYVEAAKVAKDDQLFFPTRAD